MINKKILNKNNYLAKFKELDIKNKIVFFASFIMLVSVFLPWYSDVDKYSGTTYFGFTGPLYLLGIIVFALSGANLLGQLSKIVKLPKFLDFFKKTSFIISSTATTAVLALIAVSIYMHPKFGLNISEKTLGIGIYFEFISTAILLLSLKITMKKTKFSTIDRFEESLSEITQSRSEKRPDYSNKYSGQINNINKSPALEKERFSYFSGQGKTNK